MTERTHFVYRVFDEFDALLYIGCTKVPETRYKQHVAEGKTWVQYAQRFVMSGPYERDLAFAKEAAAILAERPYFNAQRHEVGAHVQRHAASRRLYFELRMRRPDLREVREFYDTPLWDEWLAEAAAIEASLNETHPVVDDDERHAHYLNDLRRKQVHVA